MSCRVISRNGSMTGCGRGGGGTNGSCCISEPPIRLLLTRTSVSYPRRSGQRRRPGLWDGNSRRVGCLRTPSCSARAAVGEEDLTVRRGGSFYELLGIREEGSFEDVKKAYKQLARKYHPDVCPPGKTDEYTRVFIEVQEAYETLSDPQLRALYDRDLSRGIHLAFSARRKFSEVCEDRSEWKTRWQGQVSGLRNRGMYKDSGRPMSWAAKLRMEREAEASGATATATE